MRFLFATSITGNALLQGGKSWQAETTFRDDEA